MRIRLGIDQLDVDADLVARQADAPFEHIAHTKLAADLPSVDGLIPESERRIARNHKHAWKPRHIGRKVLGDTIREILLVGVVTEIGKGQDDDRQARGDGGLGDWWRGRRARRRRLGDSFLAQRIDPHWECNVLDVLLAELLEGKGNLVADLIIHCPGNANRARLGKRFQARRNIDPSPKMSSSSTMTSPRLTPMRNLMR